MDGRSSGKKEIHVKTAELIQIINTAERYMAKYHTYLIKIIRRIQLMSLISTSNQP